MDLSGYLKKNRYGASKLPERERKCLSCGNKLTQTDSHLYFQGFCSAACKERYLE